MSVESRTVELLTNIRDDMRALRAHFDKAAQPVARPPCRHPESEREVTADSTIADVVYRCKACGQEGIE